MAEEFKKMPPQQLRMIGIGCIVTGVGVMVVLSQFTSRLAGIGAVFWIGGIFFIGYANKLQKEGPTRPEPEEEKERVIIREIVKVRCEYCDHLVEQGIEVCPNCGGNM